MCGVLGFLGAESTLLPEFDALDACEGLRRRGPDHFGAFTAEVGGLQLSLWHSRLAIVDSSSSSNQPFLSRRGEEGAISFNGEIFNYRELTSRVNPSAHFPATDSDTEVLLALMVQRGREALPWLEGQWAFAYWDARRRKLLLARDRFGIKPMYYAATKDGIFFGSDLRDVSRLSGLNRPNFDVASAYLHFGDYDFDDATFIDGIRRLPPGHCLELSVTNVGEERFERAVKTDLLRWHEPKLSQPQEISREDAVAHARGLLVESVSRQLKHSDLPPAFSLSGGIDSSLILGIARKHFPEMQLSTFSFSSPGFTDDESDWAQIAISHNDVSESRSVVIRDSTIPEDLMDLVSAQGEPFISLSLLAQYSVMKAVNSSGHRIIFEGQGADELFGGYSGYPEFMLRSRLERLRIGGAARSLWYDFPEGKRRNLHLANFFSTYVPSGIRQQVLRAHLKKLHSTDRVFHKRDDQLFQPRVPYRDLELFPLPLFQGFGRRFVQRLNFAVYRNQLDMLLRHGDRNAMHFSVENRVPFLSEKLADFVLALPDRLFESRDGLSKSLLRSVGTPYLPREIRQRRDKVGFSANDASILRGIDLDRLPWLDGLMNLGVQFPDIPRNYVRDRMRSERYTPMVWRLVNLGLWATSNNMRG